jgi:flagellar hook protein FlgE
MSFNIGLSGLYAANKSLDVTGNNIANVATVGFKASRAEFADQYAQSIRGISGGTNVGSGVYTAAVSQEFSQGALTGTGRDLDLAINGNGFFMLSNNGEKLYTRAGNFHTDTAGNIVDNSGNRLQGYGVDANGNVKTGVLTDLKINTSNMPPKATGNITISSNLDSTKEINTTAAFDPEKTDTYESTFSTPIYDSQGNEHTLDQYFRKTGNNTWTMYSLIDGRNISDPTTSPVVPDETQLTFDSAGNLVSTPPPTSSANMVVNADGTFTVANWVPAQSKTTGSTTTWAANGASSAAGGMKLDMLSTTQTNAAAGALSKRQDGNYTGEITAMKVDASGNLFATYTNGESRVIGQVALSTFANTQGLAPAGGTAWRETYASGIAVTGSPGSGTLGGITGSALEESNVDLTIELVELIKAQSNYQANAKTISTESTIMQTTIQMT